MLHSSLLKDTHILSSLVSFLLFKDGFPNKETAFNPFERD